MVPEISVTISTTGLKHLQNTEISPSLSSVLLNWCLKAFWPQPGDYIESLWWTAVDRPAIHECQSSYTTPEKWVELYNQAALQRNIWHLWYSVNYILKPRLQYISKTLFYLIFPPEGSCLLIVNIKVCPKFEERI